MEEVRNNKKREMNVKKEKLTQRPSTIKKKPDIPKQNINHLLRAPQ